MRKRCDHTREESWWIYDAQGIELARVCSRFEDDKRATFRPEVFDADRYREVIEEPIEPEDYY